MPKNILQPSENNNDMVGTVDKDDALRSREKQPIGTLGLGFRIRISQLLQDKHFWTTTCNSCTSAATLGNTNQYKGLCCQDAMRARSLF